MLFYRCGRQVNAFRGRIWRLFILNCNITSDLNDTQYAFGYRRGVGVADAIDGVNYYKSFGWIVRVDRKLKF